MQRIQICLCCSGFNSPTPRPCPWSSPPRWQGAMVRGHEHFLSIGTCHSETVHWRASQPIVLSNSRCWAPPAQSTPAPNSLGLGLGIPSGGRITKCTKVQHMHKSITQMIFPIRAARRHRHEGACLPRPLVSGSKCARARSAAVVPGDPAPSTALQRLNHTKSVLLHRYRA